MVHIEPIVLICRQFPDGSKWGDEYSGVMTIQKCGDKAYCCGAHGTVSMSDYRDLKKQLEAFGIKELIWDRAP